MAFPSSPTDGQTFEDYIYDSATNSWKFYGDANTVDGVSSESFLRSDIGDSLNVGRGDVYIENNTADNASGAGITLRTSSNPDSGDPATVGNIFAIRSAGQALRLAVGQTVTSTGDNDFKIGSSGTLQGGLTAPSGTAVLGYNGDFYASRVFNAVYNDLAEFIQTAEESEAGMVVVQTEDGVSPSTERASGAVVGVHSDSYGYALGASDADNKTPVALTGRVDVWMREPCKIGDLLVSSQDKGFASVASGNEKMIPGVIIGKVLENKTNSSESRVKMLVMNR